MKSFKWSKSLIQQQQLHIKKQLDIVGNHEGPDGRLAYAVEQIGVLAEDTSPLSSLRCYIFIVSSLIHHMRFGGLSESQISRYASMATALLRIHGVRPKKSLLSFLYGDLHLALSQIYRKSGEPWKAAWEQQLALYLSKKSPSGGVGFQSLSSGIRALRLGNATIAIHHFSKAEALGVDERSLVRLRLEQIKAHRLVGDLEDSKALIAKSLKELSLTNDEKLELEWEQKLLDLLSTKDLRPILHCVRRNQSHHFDSYLIDAFLWSRAVETREWLEKYPTLQSLAWNPKIDLKHFGFLSKCVALIEKCYDSDVPYALRLQPIGKVLPEVKSLITIEKELLVWAALARWLSRNKSYQLAVLPLAEYQGISLRLSLGKTNDALGVMADLLNKPWFREYHTLSILSQSPKKAA